jgi:hypothetical protein
VAGARAFWAGGTGVSWLGAVDAAGGSGAINAGWADAVDMPTAISNKTTGMMRMGQVPKKRWQQDLLIFREG